MTYSVAPAHVAPLLAKRVELKKQMIFALEIDQPVWIIRPVLARGEMVLRPVRLVVNSRSWLVAGTSQHGQENREKESFHEQAIRHIDLTIYLTGVHGRGSSL